VDGESSTLNPEPFTLQQVHANGGAATDDHLVRLKANMRRRDAPASPSRRPKLCSFVGA